MCHRIEVKKKAHIHQANSNYRDNIHFLTHNTRTTRNFKEKHSVQELDTIPLEFLSTLYIESIIHDTNNGKTGKEVVSVIINKPPTIETESNGSTFISKDVRQI